MNDDDNKKEDREVTADVRGGAYKILGGITQLDAALLEAFKHGYMGPSDMEENRALVAKLSALRFDLHGLLKDWPEDSDE